MYLWCTVTGHVCEVVLNMLLLYCFKLHDEVIEILVWLVRIDVFK